MSVSVGGLLVFVPSSSESVVGSFSARSRDLKYAAALAGAAERMGGAATVDELWAVLLEEALALVPADGAVIVEYAARSWSLLAVRTGNGATSTDRVMALVDAAARQGLLDDPGEVNDRGPAWLVDGSGSVLVAGLDRRPSRVLTRLLWFADRPGGFAEYAELAGLISRQAGVAVRAVTSRATMGQAVEARHRVGQAQGILMNRYRLTTEQAIAVLVRYSQHTNTKVRTIADRVILTGRLGEAEQGWPGWSTPPPPP